MSKKISIVIPCLNEELVIGGVIQDCWVGLHQDRSHQVLIVDSSTDRSPEIARELGAEVLTRPKEGLGKAYIDSIPHITGEYVIMGDADGTYDYKEIDRFIEKLDQGYEFVMGSRFRGSIEKGAMPALHRYFGTPLTTWIFNRVYGTHFTDIHCGLRGMTKDAFVRMNLQSTSWEYASEMIIKSVHVKLKTTEVPIHFYGAKNGRVSHLQRSGWFTPWHAGWINLRKIFIFGADFFLFKPGIVLLAAGLITLGALTFGPIGHFRLYSMMLGMSVGILGMIAISMGMVARILYDYSNAQVTKWAKVFSYDRSVLISVLMTVVGLVLTIPLISDYIHFGYYLPNGIQPQYYSSVTGLFLIVAAFFLFTHTLLIHALSYRLAIQRTYAGTSNQQP